MTPDGGEGGGAPRLGERPSSVGDHPIALPSDALPSGRAPRGGGARGRGGESESSLSGRAAPRATRAQSEAGPAIEHDALRWP